MIHLLCGRSGSGKTTALCRLAADSLAAGRQVFLIVPEQQAVDAEQRMAELLGDRPSLGLEVLNFKRLCNRLFREYGGLSYHYISKSGRALMMWEALDALAPRLVEYADVGSAAGKAGRAAGCVSLMLRAVSEFKAYRITPSMLEKLMNSLPDDDPSAPDGGRSSGAARLRGKLSDLSLLYAAYNSLAAEVGDDAADDLDKAEELLRDHDFFAGTDVYLDSFNGFTPQEFALLRQIFCQADNVTVSLCRGESRTDEPFANVVSTADRLKQIAASLNREVKETFLTENRRAGTDDLRFLERNLWSLDLSKESAFDGEPEAVRLIECPNLFAECEAVAADILRRVRGGAKWRDFSITTRGIERYDGIIDVILEKYGVPFFLTKRTDITSKPVIRLILAALTLRARDFSLPDVLTYAKTGLAGLSPEEVSRVENYAALWRLRGSAWTEEWTMNPGGYTSRFDEEAADTLRGLNILREKLIAPLTVLYEALVAAGTVKGYCAALYSFLLSIDIPEKLRAEADALRLSEPEAASEAEQLWGILIDSFDELVSVVPDLECDCDTMFRLLTILFQDTDIGRIPGTVDEVTVGDASLIRAVGRHRYLIGANEGLFPLTPADDGVFTDADRALLSSLGAEFAGNCESRCTDERFAFYRALTAVSGSVTVTWAASDLSGKTMNPSSGVTRLKRLFPKLKTLSHASLPLADRMEGRTNLPEYLAEAGDTPLGRALRRFSDGDETLKKRTEKLSLPLFESEICLSDETNRLISGGDLALTQSRLDSYVLCHFSYFCKYILKLDEHRPAHFDSADIGTFIHRILELFVSRAEENDRFRNGITDTEIDGMVDEIIKGYMTDICRIAPDYTGSRLNHLFARLRRSSRLLCRNIADEFSQSDFTPEFFELPINFNPSDEKRVAPLRVPLDDRTSAYLYGVADRVDTLRRDGKLYIRVIDYKTGSKDFSMNDVAMGLNLQMLLYLFSLCQNGKRSDSALRVSPEEEILPAGVLYFSAGVPTVTLDAEVPPEEVEQMVSDKLARKGILLDDENVLRAMERELAGRYLPVRVKKDGTYTRSDALKTLEDFGTLLGSIEDTIGRIGNEIRRGNASAHPINNMAHRTCDFCKMKPVCRRFGQDS